MKRACIIGIGNELRRDDGIGLEILRHLNSAGAGQNYDLIPLGQNILELASIIGQYHRAIIIDALPPGEQPGKIIMTGWYQGLSIVRQCMSLHDFDLFEQIKLIQMRGIRVDLQLIGIVSADLGLGFGLSDNLRMHLKEIVEEIRGWLSCNTASMK